MKKYIVIIFLLLYSCQKDYIEDLLFDVEGIKPAKISVRMTNE